jgi:transposase
VTDGEWDRVRELVPELQPLMELRGRKGIDARMVLNSALWVFAYDKPWAALPGCFPAYQSCHRRWKLWLDAGAFERIAEVLFGNAAGEFMITVRRRIAQKRPAHTDCLKAKT